MIVTIRSVDGGEKLNERLTKPLFNEYFSSMNAHNLGDSLGVDEDRFRPQDLSVGYTQAIHGLIRMDVNMRVAWGMGWGEAGIRLSTDGKVWG